MPSSEERYTQDERTLNIATPLGKDFLLIDSMFASEAISELFSFEIEVRHQEENETGSPTEVTPQQILGKNVTVQIFQEDETSRFFNGIVSRFSQGNRERRFTHYRLEVVPQHWLLTQVRQSRIFQNKSVPDILRDVLRPLPYKLEIQGEFKPRNYCVQYRESDFDFISRLMEEEGIYYYFEHSEDSHQMIIANEPGSHRDCPSKSTVRFAEERVYDSFNSVVSRWTIDFALQTGKVAFWDHKFELPTKKLNVEKQSRFNAGNAQNLESYDYPGGYARKFDGISSGGGEQASDLQGIFEDNTRKAEIAMDVLDSRFRISTGESDCSAFTAGYRFTLEEHPISSYDGRYVLTSVLHRCVQSPGYVSDDQPEAPYSNEFKCITHGAGAPPFRPLPKTPKPIVQGSQTAMVVGPGGEEIFTDKYGRVKVQFHWDRHGQNDSGSSCWVRVAQDWAGKKWGTVFIPRIGMEVIVDFLEGDPDQPIIVGSVYNAETMPPYTLPDEKTKSTIKTNSSTGGGGFNELRFEDKKGSEQIFIHAQKDMDVRVLNDKKEIVLNDKHTIVKNHQYSEGKGDSHTKLTGDNNEEIGGSKSLKVTGDIDIKASGKIAIDSGQEVHIKAGMKIVLEAGAQISLKVGGNFVDINPAGVSVKGTMIMLNSGGAAGSGSGCSPTSPTAPKEADKAEGGQSGGAQAEMPAPPPAGNYGGGAGAMGGAANDGAPFVGGGGAGSGGGSGGGQAPSSGGDSPEESKDGSAGGGSASGGSAAGGESGSSPEESKDGPSGGASGGQSGEGSAPAEGGAAAAGGGESGGTAEGPSGGAASGEGSGTGGDDGSRVGGTRSTQNADGSSSVQYPDGTTVTEDADGTRTTINPDGSVKRETPEGTVATENPDGTTTVKNPDGTTDIVQGRIVL